MCAPKWLCCALLILCAVDGAWSWVEGHYRRTPRSRERHVHSYPRDWDTDWPRTQALARRRSGRGPRLDWEPGDHVPEYDYQADTPASPPSLRPRLLVVPPGKQETRGVWHSQQRGSVTIPYHGATVRVRPSKEYNHKFYKGTVTSTVVDAPRRRGNRIQRHRNKGTSHQEHWQYSQDEPMLPKVCARCPSDRAVLAKKGSVTVLMEVPPIIPCQTWSSVEKVKQEVVAGPKPGEEVPEGSHKIVIQFKHRRRVIATCATRYNVIVRKCPDLDTGPGVKTKCPLGKAWGSRCNITCDPGYELEGDSFTECTDDLEWSGIMPQCVPTTSCPVPVTPDNGHLSCRTPQHRPIRPKDMLPDGSVCHFLCDPGYTIPPALEHLTKVRCIAGSWDSDQDPVCIETNELEDDEPPPEITAEDALRFDGDDCPQNYCHNGGKCIMILNDPMCSCKPGYSGHHCEYPPDPDPDESNTIT